VTLSPAGLRRLEALEVLATTPEPRWAVFLPIRVQSRANDHRSNHWGRRAKTSSEHSDAAMLALSRLKATLRKQLDKTGLVVRVVRIAPRELDSHDNLGMSLKAITDGVARALGVDDRDPRVRFEPDPERGAPKTWGVRIEFYEGPTT
jgi:hypothetical protein